jgi:FMN-dependent NADH-azoreductase
MTTFLRIHGSIRSASRSGALADYFLHSLGQQTQLELIGQRNVGVSPPSSPDAEFVVANQTPDDAKTSTHRERLSESDSLIEEFLKAELVVVSTPMYNFSVGAGLKAWVDNLIRNNKTFAVSELGIQRFAEGKRMVVISTRGLAYGAGSPFASCDHIEPWLRDIFGFIGVEQIDFITADNLDFAGPAAEEESIRQAKVAIDELVSNW